MNHSFLRAFLSGFGVAGAIGIGLFVMMLFVGASDDLFLTVFLMFGVLVVAFVGSALTGALVGVTAARNAPSRLTAAGAAPLAAILGQFVILLLVFVGAGVAFSDGGDTSEDGFITDEESSAPLDWSEFGTSLLVLLPAGVAAAVAAPASFRPRTDATQDLGSPMPRLTEEPLPEHTHAGPMGALRRLSCPRCRTVNHVPSDGGVLSCSGCGLRGRVPA